MTATAQAQTVIGATRFAVRFGLPLDEVTFTSSGDGETVLTAFAEAEKALAKEGVRFERADTDLVHRLIIHPGDGVTVRWFHSRCTSLEALDRSVA